MSDNETGGGGGCLTLILLALAAFALVMWLGGGDTTTTSTDTRSGLLSGNQTEVLSRNQLNLFSDVWNCFGDGSCIITTEMITDITTSNEVIDVTGDRNTITWADGRTACEDPNFPGQYAPEYCDGNWGQP